MMDEKNIETGERKDPENLSLMRREDVKAFAEAFAKAYAHEQHNIEVEESRRLQGSLMKRAGVAFFRVAHDASDLVVNQIAVPVVKFVGGSALVLGLTTGVVDRLDPPQEGDEPTSLRILKYGIEGLESVFNTLPGRSVPDPVDSFYDGSVSPGAQDETDPPQTYIM